MDPLDYLGWRTDEVRGDIKSPRLEFLRLNAETVRLVHRRPVTRRRVNSNQVRARRRSQVDADERDPRVVVISDRKETHRPTKRGSPYSYRQFRRTHFQRNDFAWLYGTGPVRNLERQLGISRLSYGERHHCRNRDGLR